jgi:hypothetical protein
VQPGALGSRNREVRRPIALLNSLKVTISSFQDIVDYVFRTRRQMKFFTKFARKLSAIVLNAAFPSACCTRALVAAANAGCFSCTTTCQAVRRADTCSDSHNSARNSLALQTRLQVTSRLRLHHALRVPVVMNDQSPSSQERIPPHFGEQVGIFLRRPTPLPHAPADRQTSVHFLRLAHRMPNQHAAAVLERSPYGPRIRVRTAKHFASSL